MRRGCSAPVTTSTARWTRQDRLQPFTLAADNGAPILLTPGRTFVELPRGQFGVTFVTPLPADG